MHYFYIGEHQIIIYYCLCSCCCLSLDYLGFLPPYHFLLFILGGVWFLLFNLLFFGLVVLNFCILLFGTHFSIFFNMHKVNFFTTAQYFIPYINKNVLKLLCEMLW